MAFKPLPGNQGMIYVPDRDAGGKKNPCPDCFSCQWCGNERCRTCRSNTCCKKKKRRHTTAAAEMDNPGPQDSQDKAASPGFCSPSTTADV